MTVKDIRNLFKKGAKIGESKIFYLGDSLKLVK